LPIFGKDVIDAASEDCFDVDFSEAGCFGDDWKNEHEKGKKEENLDFHGKGPTKKQNRVDTQFRHDD
jgi:hypothetical protein